MCAGTSSAIASRTCVDGQLGVVGADGRGQNVGAAGRRHQGRDRCCHAGYLPQRGLDLADFDAVAADFDAVVGASDELQGAVRPVPGQIAGAVPGPAVVLDETLGGEIRTSAVAPRDAASGNPQLAGDPVGAVAAHVVDHPAGIVGQRHAERQRGPVRRQLVELADLENRVVHCGFGRTTQTGEAQRGRVGAQAANHLGPHPVTAGGHHPHRRQPSRA